MKRRQARAGRIEIQGSSSRARTTPSESAPRNLGGIVSRFFASSVYSYCPRKANPRVLPVEVRSGAGKARWEEPRHPRPVQRGPHCTPLPPLCNTLGKFLPLRLLGDSARAEKAPLPVRNSRLNLRLHRLTVPGTSQRARDAPNGRFRCSESALCAAADGGEDPGQRDGVDCGQRREDGTADDRGELRGRSRRRREARARSCGATGGTSANSS